MPFKEKQVEEYNDFLDKISDSLFYPYNEFKVLYLEQLSKNDNFLLGMDIEYRYQINKNNIDKCYFRGSKFIEVFTEDEVLEIAKYDDEYQQFKEAI